MSLGCPVTAAVYCYTPVQRQSGKGVSPIACYAFTNLAQLYLVFCKEVSDT